MDLAIKHNIWRILRKSQCGAFEVQHLFSKEEQPWCEVSLLKRPTSANPCTIHNIHRELIVIGSTSREVYGEMTLQSGLAIDSEIKICLRMFRTRLKKPVVASRGRHSSKCKL